MKGHARASLNMSHLPYYPISQYYKDRFGEKVYKVPVAVADDCPNRRGLKGMQTCIFCDEWGSAANKDSHKLELRSQIEKVRMHMMDTYNAKKFLVYFQAYTNTFDRLPALRLSYDTALSYEDVVGFVVGTRPDCLSKALFNTWNEYAEKTAVFVELGVQSLFNDQLEFIRRGHTREQSIEAILRLASETPKINVGVHLMFGMPNETDEQIIETAEVLSKLPVSNIKLHNLHVLINTPLADLFHKGEFTPIDFETYSHRVKLFLQHLRPTIAVHRLGAVASRWNELVAPEWTRHKMAIFQNIIDYMKDHNAHQGQLYEPKQNPGLDLALSKSSVLASQTI